MVIKDAGLGGGSLGTRGRAKSRSRSSTGGDGPGQDMRDGDCGHWPTIGVVCRVCRSTDTIRFAVLDWLGGAAR